MKKLIPIILTVLLLTACTNSSTSIGIIGGSDGPTSIIVANQDGDVFKKPMRMIKVSGKLYYDTGDISKIVGRCGNFDGNLKQTGAEHEIPENNDECNFSGAEGYQNTSNITKEVCIGNQWIIFRLFDDPEQDMSIYKYCFYLSGRMSKASDDSEIVVLTQDENIDFNKFSSQMLSSQASAGEEYKTTFRLYDEEGITLYVKNVTNKGLTLVFEHYDDEVENEDLQTGDWFRLQKEDNGKWTDVEAKQDAVFNSIAYGINKNSTTELEVDWSFLYGELLKGNYRIAKEVLEIEEPGDFDKELYYAEFTVQ